MTNKNISATTINAESAQAGQIVFSPMQVGQIIFLNHDGKRYALNPKDDLSVIESLNISVMIGHLTANHQPGSGCDWTSYIEKNQLQRHFETTD